MTVASSWTPVEGTPDEILRRYPRPLEALVAGEIPAIVLRRAYNPDHCAALMKRFYERGLLYDPRTTEDGEPRRVDIGTSLGSLSADQEKFLAHAAGTNALFETLFEGYDDPVNTIYDALSRMAPDKRTMTAREPDGRLYGPAIFRTYHAGTGHDPHFDSVAKRSKLFNYAVSRFEHQFSGVLCFQNSTDEGESGEPLLFNCPWTPNLQEILTEGTFHEYARERRVSRVQVQLEPGDLYFFYTFNIHEVPSVTGEQPRTVLAIFFGMSPDDPEIFVWS